MEDKQTPGDQDTTPEQETPSAGPADRGETTTRTDNGTPQHEPGTGDSGSGWPDLAAYVAALRAEHASWLERVTAVQTQLAAVRPVLAGIASQYAVLGIEEDLAQLNEQVLGGAAIVQTVRLAFDLERYVAIFWPSAGDPRPTMAREGDEGEYRVEIWLHMDEQGRGRVRVEGEKKLEAPLPTSRERLRRVLISAIQSPRFVPSTAGAPGEEAMTTGQQPAEGEFEEQPVEAATPRPGDPEDQLPPEEQVIPLGPSAGGSGDDKPDSPASEPET